MFGFKTKLRRLTDFLDKPLLGEWSTLDEFRNRCIGASNTISMLRGDKVYLLECLKSLGVGSENDAYFIVARNRIASAIKSEPNEGEYHKASVAHMPKSEIDRAIESLRNDYPGWGFRRCAIFPSAWRVYAWPPGVKDHYESQNDNWDRYLSKTPLAK